MSAGVDQCPRGRRSRALLARRTLPRARADTALPAYCRAQPPAAVVLPFELRAPFADIQSAVNGTNATNATNATNSTRPVNGTAIVILEGAAFFTPSLGVDATALRAALAAAAAARGSGDLRIVDLWLTTAFTFAGLTPASAASVGFEPSIAAGATTAFLASALGVPPERITAHAPSFEPVGWRLELTVTGFEGHIADVNAAAAKLADPVTAEALGDALASLLCDSDGEACVMAEAVLAPPSVRAVAAEVGAAVDLDAHASVPPPPPPQAPMHDDPALSATLGVVLSGFGARCSC
jgi:hypothetical protein